MAVSEPPRLTPKRNAGNHRKLLPAEAVLKDRGLPPGGGLVLRRQGLSECWDSSMKSKARPCGAATLLAAAVCGPFRCESLPRRAVESARWAAARSSRPHEQTPHRRHGELHRETLLDECADPWQRQQIPWHTLRRSFRASAA